MIAVHVGLGPYLDAVSGGLRHDRVVGDAVEHLAGPGGYLEDEAGTTLGFALHAEQIEPGGRGDFGGHRRTRGGAGASGGRILTTRPLPREATGGT